MEKQNKQYIVPILILIIVTVVITGLIQLVGIGIDWIRVQLNLPIVETSGTATSSDTPMVNIEPIINTEIIVTEVASSTNEFAQFDSANSKVNLHPSTLVTPPSLIEVCENPNGGGAINQEECNKEIAKITKVINVIEQPSEGWMYVKAGVSRGDSPVSGLHNTYDSVWFFLDKNIYAGHLVASDAVSRTSSDGLTELLYRLDEVTLTNLPNEINPTDKRKVNLLEALTPGNHYVAAFVSTLGRGELHYLEFGFADGKVNIRE